MMNQDSAGPAIDQLEQSLTSSRLPYLAALILALLALPAFALDISLARYVAQVNLPGDVRDLVRISEVFAHGLGVALILITVLVLVPERRRHVLRLFACAAGSGCLALLIKNTIARRRPQSLHMQDWQGSVWSTFEGWAPWISGQGSGGNHLQSFPSGHTATAVGLAVGLAFLWPRGRWLFASFAALAALQRIDCGAHFLSDTLVAAALACLVAGFCIDRRAVGKHFDRWEAKATDKDD